MNNSKLLILLCLTMAIALWGETPRAISSTSLTDPQISFFTLDQDSPEFTTTAIGGTPTPYYPNAECENKHFIGWTTTRVDVPQQTSPEIIDFKTAKFESNTNLYAVYAFVKGGEWNGSAKKEFTDKIRDMSQVNDTLYSSLHTQYALVNANKRTDEHANFFFQTETNTTSSMGIKIDKKATITTLHKIRDLISVEVGWEKVSNSVTLDLQISSDGNQWETKQICSTSTGSDGEVLTFTLDEYGDYYVRVEASSTGSILKKVNITRFLYRRANRDYRYSSYSTNCAIAEPEDSVVVNGDETLSTILANSGVNAANLDLVVFSGSLLVDTSVTIHDLDIYADAIVKVENATLRLNQLNFRGGITDDENAYSYNVPSLYIAPESSVQMESKTIYYYLSLSSSNYAPFALPFRASVASIRFASYPDLDITSQLGKGYNIATYDGEERAKQTATTSKYWHNLSSSDWIEPSRGYIVTAKKLKGETHATLRFAMSNVDNAWMTNGEQGTITITNDNQVTNTEVKNQVQVTAWGIDDNTVKSEDKAWNYIANPYMSAINRLADFHYLTIPTVTMDGYDQISLEDDIMLRPFYGAFVQAGKTQSVTILRPEPQKGPAFFTTRENNEQTIYINLTGEGYQDRFGFLVGQQYTDKYEINADLSKELGSATDLRAWITMDDTKFAYIAISDETAQKHLSIALRTPTNGEYTFSLRQSSRVDDLEGIYLYDNESNIMTNLLHNDYSFYATEDILNNRFFISIVRKNSSDKTNINFMQRKAKHNHYKRLIDGHVYIVINGRVFDAEGFEVKK